MRRLFKRLLLGRPSSYTLSTSTSINSNSNQKTGSVISAIDLLNEFTQIATKDPIDVKKRTPTKIYPKTISVRERYEQFQKKYPNYIVLMQVGDFYEFYGQEAVKSATDLLDLASNKAGDMTGFPIRSFDTYMRKLLNAGKSVVIAEQFAVERDSGKGKFDRQVTRIVTPGTVTQDNLLDSVVNNFLLCVCSGQKGDGEGSLGMAWIDVSTGLLVVGECNKDTFASQLFRINPKEVLLDKILFNDKQFRQIIQQQGLTAIQEVDNPTDSLTQTLLSTDLDLTISERVACDALLEFVRGTQAGQMPIVEEPVRQTDTRFMSIDASALKSLDLTSNSVTKERGPSLISVIDQTKTAMGTRLLVQRLEKAVIDRRLDVVSVLMQNEMLRRRLVDHLENCYDLPRALQRLTLNRESGGPRDMRQVGETLATAMKLKADIADTQLISFCTPLGTHTALSKELLSAMAETSVPSRVSDGGAIALAYSPQLDNMKLGKTDLQSGISLLATKYQQETGLKSLEVKSIYKQGYFISIPKKNKEILANNSSFWLESETETETRWTTAELRRMNSTHKDSEKGILELEMELYEKLRLKVVKHARSIMKCANQLGELDVAVSMAEAAISGGFVRPELLENSSIWKVDHGRHPVIDNILAEKGTSFVSNSCHLNNPVALITGPNMGGKSTFLRQNALIAIMAQAGSFVPAKSATIGIVDAVYTRIGAADDLTRDRSTFMVEMEETAKICRQATQHSLVLMDEVGRGTSGDEGLALAYGIVKHLVSVGCRTLFATHLTNLAKYIPDGAVEKWRTSVTHDEQGNLVVVPKVIQGVSEQSYAISIARLAGTHIPPHSFIVGIPENVLEEASHHLERIRLT